MEKVEAWRTSDGQLWRLDMESFAKKHQEILDSKKDAKKLFEENKEDILKRMELSKEYYLGYIDEDEDEDESDIFPYLNEEWECESKENKVGYCISVSVDPEGCCIYCGEPDERK